MRSNQLFFVNLFGGIAWIKSLCNLFHHFDSLFIVKLIFVLSFLQLHEPWKSWCTFQYKIVLWGNFKSEAKIWRANSRLYRKETFLFITHFCSLSEGGKKAAIKSMENIFHMQRCFLQVGIVSWGVGCGSTPGVYTNVVKFTDWIINIIRQDKTRSVEFMKAVMA